MALCASPTLTFFNSKLSSPMFWIVFIPHLHEKTAEALRTPISNCYFLIVLKISWKWNSSQLWRIVVLGLCREIYELRNLTTRIVLLYFPLFPRELKNVVLHTANCVLFCLFLWSVKVFIGHCTVKFHNFFVLLCRIWSLLLLNMKNVEAVKSYVPIAFLIYAIVNITNSRWGQR